MSGGPDHFATSKAVSISTARAAAITKKIVGKLAPKQGHAVRRDLAKAGAVDPSARSDLRPEELAGVTLAITIEAVTARRRAAELPLCSPAVLAPALYGGDG